jgi:hypothetical protein
MKRKDTILKKQKQKKRWKTMMIEAGTKLKGKANMKIEATF